MSDGKPSAPRGKELARLREAARTQKLAAHLLDHRSDPDARGVLNDWRAERGIREERLGSILLIATATTAATTAATTDAATAADATTDAAADAAATAADAAATTDAAVPTRAAVIDELVAALRLFHPNNATELYERAAEDFYKATRLMAPGKSVPLELAYDSEQEAKRQELWRPFIGRWREQFIDAVLAKAGAK